LRSGVRSKTRESRWPSPTPKASTPKTETPPKRAKHAATVIRDTAVIFRTVGCGVSSPVSCGTLNWLLYAKTMLLMEFM